MNMQFPAPVPSGPGKGWRDVVSENARSRARRDPRLFFKIRRILKTEPHRAPHPGRYALALARGRLDAPFCPGQVNVEARDSRRGRLRGCGHMRIWIDADLAPRGARDIACRAGERLEIEVRCVSAREAATAHVRLMEEVEEGDVVITRGARLGKDFVQRGAVAIDVRGEEFTAASIAEETERETEQLLASIQHFSTAGRGPPPYDARAKRDFAATLDRVLARLS